MKAQGTPMLGAQDTTNVAAAPVPQYTQQQYQSQMYPPHEQPNTAYQQQTAYPPQPDTAYAQQTPAAAVPVVDPYAQQPAQPYAAYPDPNQAQYQGTPAPGQPYYPPQHPPQQ